LILLFRVFFDRRLRNYWRYRLELLQKEGWLYYKRQILWIELFDLARLWCKRSLEGKGELDR
jgi:hypothetical protein